jgi:hypothetical protein
MVGSIWNFPDPTQAMLNNLLFIFRVLKVTSSDSRKFWLSLLLECLSD